VVRVKWVPWLPSKNKLCITIKKCSCKNAMFYKTLFVHELFRGSERILTPVENSASGLK
jgi:hypothetical protein